MSKLYEKLSRLEGDTPSTWMADAKYRRDNRAWLKKSATIAFIVLDELEAQQLSQKELAERMKISPQQINKIVKGQENLTLETISKLEAALGITIIDVKSGQNKASTKGKKPAA